MVLLRSIERACWLHLHCAARDLGAVLLRDLLLCVAVVVDAAAVLRAYIVALPVLSLGVHPGEEEVAQLVEADLRGVEEWGQGWMRVQYLRAGVKAKGGFLLVGACASGMQVAGVENEECWQGMTLASLGVGTRRRAEAVATR